MPGPDLTVQRLRDLARETVEPTAGRHAAPSMPFGLPLRAVLVLAVVAVLVAGAVYWRGRPHAVSSAVTTSLGSVPLGEATPVPTGAVGEVVVHVVGRVRKPGLFRLKPGARIADAVAAAGGLVPRTDPASVNLAQTVSDGQQIVIGITSIAGSGSATSGKGSGGPERIDLNTATVEQLDTLPGVGPVLAERILAWRTANGGFRSVDDLRQVQGIGDKKFADLKLAVRI